MNRINTVNVTQHVFEEASVYLNLHLLSPMAVNALHNSFDGAERGRSDNCPGIILKITRTTDGDFMFEKVKEYP